MFNDSETGMKRSLVYLKYSLCFYNFVFLLAGCGVCGLGLWSVLDQWDLINMIPSPVFQSLVWLVISTGFVSVVVALIGYAAVAFESRCLLAWYTILLVLIFIIESIICLLSYVYQDKLGTDLQDNLKEHFIYPYSFNQDSTIAVDNIQQKYDCCGADSYKEWLTSGWHSQYPGYATPDTCCKTLSPGCGIRDHPSNINYTGCRHRIFDVVAEYLVYISCVSVFIAVLQICGIMLTTSIFSNLHKHEKYNSCSNENEEVKNWIDD